MSFCDPVFLFFFLPLTLAVYFAAPRGLKNAVLCIASFLFYLDGDKNFAPWLLGSIALNYLLGLGIQAYRRLAAGRFLLWLGVCSDLGLLVVFKYLNFLRDNLNVVRESFGHHAHAYSAIALPLGISFFTFHKISYKVDVWRGDCQARRNVTDLFLYILLFPQLIAGPIVRFNEVAPALRNRRVDLASFSSGAQRFCFGLAKKMMLANPLAVMADALWGAPGVTTGLALDAWDAPSAWVAAISYTLQIYFDFSGYSDMAVGLAALFGFRFPENFDFPYRASSVTDFWRRWHMSLSRWFRDYVYIPLGGNRGTLGRTLFNLSCVFLLCGFWHGAQWTFVAWGVYHGSLLVMERALLATLPVRRLATAIPRAPAQAYALLAVTVGWVFFRADSLAQAQAVLAGMFGLGAPSRSTASLWSRCGPEAQLAVVAGVWATLPMDRVLLVVQRLVRERDSLSPSAPIWDGLRYAVPALVSLCLLTYAATQLAGQAYNPFIYYRF